VKYNLNNKKVLILKLQGMGDSIMFLPMIDKLLKDFPQIHLDLAVAKNGIDEILKLTKYNIKNIYTVRCHIIGYLQLLLKIMFKYYIIILPYKSGKRENLISFFSFCPRRMGYAYMSHWRKYYYLLFDFLINIKLNPEQNMHYLFLNLKLAEFLSLKPYKQKKFYPDIKIFKSPAKKIKELTRLSSIKKYIVFHIGVVDIMRRWDINKYTKLIKRIIQEYKKYEILLVGKGEEQEINKRIIKQIHSNRIINIPESSLISFLMLLKKSDLVIGNDSGVMHLASLVKAPILSIWGYTNPLKTAPAGNNIYILRKNIDCSPCYKVMKQTKCRIKQRRCLDLIRVDDVWTVLNKILMKKSIKSEKLATGTYIINL